MKIDLSAFTRKLLPALITVTLLATVFWVADTNEVFSELRRFPVLGIVGVLVLLGINLSIVNFRLTRVFRNFGLDLPMGVVTRANISGHLAGLFFISLFGQVAGRHLVLRRSGIPPVLIASLTAYERAIALLISGGLFFVGATLLFDSLLIEDFLNRISLAEITSVVAIGFVLSMWLWGTRFESYLSSKILSWSQLQKLIEISLITIIARLFVLSAFVVAVTSLRSDIDYLNLFAAAAITSFAANLPLTIHGWGLRELAAVYTLGLLGVPASEALAISILIGLCSTAVILIAAPLVIGKHGSSTLRPKLNAQSFQQRIEVEKVSVWVLSMVTAGLVFFQIHVRIYDGVINLNLSDPFAILSIAALAAHVYTTRKLPTWHVTNFNSILVVISLLLMLAFLNGLNEIGPTQWALANRLTGWFVILGYLSSGYLIVSYLGNHGLRRLSVTIITFAVVVVLMRAMLRYLAINGWIELSYFPLRFEAYAGNRNAFAFQMLVCSSLLLAYSAVFIRADRGRAFFGRTNNSNSVPRFGVSAIKEKRNLLLMSAFHGVILAGLAFSGSRAGLIAGVILLVAATLLKLVDWRLIVLSVVFATIIWVLPMLDFGLSSDSRFAQLLLAREVSDTERWETLSRAFALWLESPIFGAGLGVFIEKSRTGNNTRGFSYEYSK